MLSGPGTRPHLGRAGWPKRPTETNRVFRRGLFAMASAADRPLCRVRRLLAPCYSSQATLHGGFRRFNCPLAPANHGADWFRSGHRFRTATCAQTVRSLPIALEVRDSTAAKPHRGANSLTGKVRGCAGPRNEAAWMTAGCFHVQRKSRGSSPASVLFTRSAVARRGVHHATSAVPAPKGLFSGGCGGANGALLFAAVNRGVLRAGGGCCT